MKKILLLIGLALAQVSAHAGNTISGRIIDEVESAPLIGATASIIDSSGKFVTGTTADVEGRFILNNINNGCYEILFEYLGYNEGRIEITNLDRDVDLGDIRLIVSAVSLDEIVVSGDAVIKKSDRQMILPTQKQKRAATNGINLLQQMPISRISVSPMDKTIKTTLGEDVQLRINGIEATKEEVSAIRPTDVIRVEYLDNPGLRYGGAAAVLDYIVRKREDGGNIAGDLTNGITHLGYGQYNLSAKYNWKKSAISAAASWQRRDLEWTRENYEDFIYPDYTVHNIELGEPTKVKFDYMNFALNYNMTDERSVFNIALRNSYDDKPNAVTDRNSTLYQGDKIYSISDKLQQRSYIPSLDIYYQLNLINDQHLYFDIVGTYINSSSHRKYSMVEIGSKDSTPTIISQTEGDKYSIIGEAIYERPLGNGKMTAGIKHTQAYMNNIYDGNISSKVSMNTAESYLFAEYNQTINRFTYMLGLGGMRTRHQQGKLSQEKYILRPTITLSYNAPKNFYFRYNAYMSGYSPSLSDLSDVTQEIDIYQVRRGNPNLHSVSFISNSLTASWKCKYVSIELFGRYSYDHKPIMEETLFENDHFVRTMANQKGFHRLNIQSTIQMYPWEEYIMIKLNPFFNRYISNGNTYTHTHSNLGFRSSIVGKYKNWIAMAEMNTSFHDLWGETLSRGEALHSIAIGYNHDKFSIQGMIMNPFTKRYEQSVDNLSALAPNKQLAYSTQLSRIVMLNVSFNLGFGKQYNNSRKRINNSDNESGILSGTK
ncbi:MAG: TonB-dependent receptor [Muribaculaceae bacterium]|nr:TonB-dependent receptor [Muribaculaceae bacterium]